MKFTKCSTENTKHTTAYRVYHNGEYVGTVGKIATTEFSWETTPTEFIWQNSCSSESAFYTREQAAQMLIN